VPGGAYEVTKQPPYNGREFEMAHYPGKVTQRVRDNHLGQRLPNLGLSGYRGASCRRQRAQFGKN